MTDKEKKKILEISKRIGYKVGTYCNDEEVEVFEKLLKDYKYKNNLIEKQQEEIENLKNRIKHQDKEMTKAVDYTFELNKEIEKQDKIIDELAFVVSQMETGIKTIIIQEQKKYCEFIKSDEDCCWKTDKACTDCIKEYFKNKVNSSEQN